MTTVSQNKVTSHVHYCLRTSFLKILMIPSLYIMTYNFYLRFIRQETRKEAVAETSFEIGSFKVKSCETAVILKLPT